MHGDPKAWFVNARTSALDSVVFGVDIQSGDVRGDSPSYALVEFDGDQLTRDVVTGRKLRRRIESVEPTLVGTDNMYELAEDKPDLVRFLRSLPADTSLVQVTGGHQPEPLSRVAGRHGVPYGKSPMKEAEAAARLAAANVGQRVTAFDDTTQLKVSRGRSTGSGGWSEDRFTRRIHGNVKKRAREVERELQAANVAYERDVTEKYGGYQNAVFTVEAPPSELPVSSERAGDTRIEIERDQKDGIEFEPLVQRRDHVLVGIDPGTTTAVAVVSLDGNPLEAYSTRTDDTAAVVEWVIERGRPVVIAADVEPMPETVESFRRSFDAAGWTPERDLPVDEKLHRTRQTTYDNDHERDALAAALFAFDAYEDQFDRIRQKVPAGIDTEEVIAQVVGDEASVESVLREMDDTTEKGPQEDSHEPRELSEEERRIRELENRVDRLRDHTNDLRTQVESKDERIAELEAELSDARREERREAKQNREVTRLQRKAKRLRRQRDEAREEVSELESKLARLKTLWKLDHDDFTDVAEGRDLVPVKVIEQFTTDAVRAADDQYGLASGDVIYLRDASGAGRATAERLAATDPRVVLRHENLSEAADQVLFDHEIPVGPAEDVEMQEVDELAVARESDVEAVIDDWEQRAARRRREQTAEMVDKIISEHRAESNSDD